MELGGLGAGVGGLGAGSRRVLGHGQHRGGQAGYFGLLVEVEQPVVQPEVAPHQALGCLGFPAADDGGDAIADGHDRAVHLVAEQAGALAVDADRLVGQPEVRFPGAARAGRRGQPVEDHLLAQRHLRLVLRAEQHFQVRLAGEPLDRRAVRGVVMVLQAIVHRLLHRVQGRLLARNRPVGRLSVTGQATKELAGLQVETAQERIGLGLVGEVDREGAIRTELHEGRGDTLGLRQGERGAIAEVDEAGAGEQADDPFRQGGFDHGDAEDAVGLPGGLDPAFDGVGPHEGRSRAVEQEIAAGECFGELGGRLGERARAASGTAPSSMHRAYFAQPLTANR